MSTGSGYGHRCFGFYSWPSECISPYLTTQGWERETEEMHDFYSSLANHMLCQATNILKYWACFPFLSCMISLQFLDWHRTVVMVVQQTV